MIVVKGDILSPDAIKIQLDGVDVVPTVPNIVSAMTLLLAVYYVYDIAYPREASNSLCFIQKYLLKLDTISSKTPNTILRLAGAIL